ncbi:hypothetical protein M0804_001367 [Polistes exclamans]|nr:hypothetical protein M0804_001367 [Polistes exclamans]
MLALSQLRMRNDRGPIAQIGVGGSIHDRDSHSFFNDRKNGNCCELDGAYETIILYYPAADEDDADDGNDADADDDDDANDDEDDEDKRK